MGFQLCNAIRKDCGVQGDDLQDSFPGVAGYICCVRSILHFAFETPTLIFDKKKKKHSIRIYNQLHGKGTHDLLSRDVTYLAVI